MEKIEKSIEVRCPVRVVYDQWTRFEDFPEFMSSVTEVRQIDDTHVHCHAEIRGEDRELDAEIIDQLPNEHIAWKSLSGTPSVGVVHFQPLGPRLTRVRLMMAYEPAGTADGTREALESLGARIQDTVEDFKWFIEHQARGTGASPRTTSEQA
jgi:uncharacterized membrane protein